MNGPDPFNLDEDEADELGIDYHVSNLGADFFEPATNPELGAGFSVTAGGSASTSGSASGSVSVGGKKRKRKKLIRPKKHTKAQIKELLLLRKRLKRSRQRSVGRGAKKVSFATLPRRFPKHAPSAVPRRTPATALPRREAFQDKRAPKPSPLHKGFGTTTTRESERRQYQHKEVSPMKLELARRGYSPTGCPEHQIGDPEKKIVRLLATAKVQRDATSEHRGLMATTEFRARVLRLLRRCVYGSQGRPMNSSARRNRIRDKCRKTRVCT